MGTSRKLLALIVAVAALGAVAANASAFRATLERGGAISMASEGKITWGPSGLQIECAYTLSGTLAASFELTAGSQIGEVTEVRASSCSGGELEDFLGLPWRLTVNRVVGRGPDSYTGLLLNVVEWSWKLNTFFRIINCLYRGAAGLLIGLNDAGTNRYTTARVTVLDTVEVPLFGGGELCPSEAVYRGTFNLSPQQSITVS